jgi:arginase
MPMSGKTRIGIAKLSYGGQFGLRERSDSVDVIDSSLGELFDGLGCEVVESKTAELTPEDSRQYGAQNRFGLASAHLAGIVSGYIHGGIFPLGLLQNCNGLIGMLAGLQRSGTGWKPLRVGLVYIDAHGDFNTPETSLSGMLGGMPVAVSCGLCLERLRRTCGLDPPLPTKYVTMVGVRDTDPLEQELIDRSDVEHITVDEVKRLSPAIDMEMERLATLTDLIYVHVDMDVLDPPEVPGHGLRVEGGPTSLELAEALEVMFEHPKAASFGLASYPSERDPGGVSLKAVHNLIGGVVRGLMNRED